MNITNNEISEFWLNASESNYAPTLKDIIAIKTTMNLNDWGVYKLIGTVTSKIHPGNPNLRRLHHWFLVNKLGYECRIGISNQKIVLLPAFKEKIYNRPYFETNGVRYVAISDNVSDISTYPSIPRRGNLLSLKFKKPLVTSEDIDYKRLVVEVNKQIVDINIPVNKNLIDFYRDYPLTELHVYSSAPFSASSMHGLLSSVTPLIEDLSSEEAVILLNNTIQNSKEYQHDLRHFGFEKHLFPEEVLYFEKSDCEDRVILLASLIKLLLNEKCIALDYKGHVVLGLPDNIFPDNRPNINVNGNEYVLLDPTYINAPIGMLPPDIVKISPGLIKLYNAPKHQIGRSEAVKLRNKFLIEHEYSNESGNFYAGILLYDTVIGNKKLSVSKNTNSYLFGEMNSEIKILVALEGTGDEYIHTFSFDRKGNLYLMGSFIDSLRLGKRYLHNSDGDIFVAKLNSEYNPEWLIATGISNLSDSIPEFSSIYNSDGELIYLNKAISRESGKSFNISFDKDQNCYITGSKYFSGALTTDSISFAKKYEFDIINWLLSENSRLIKSNLDPTITPLITITNFVANSSIPLTGNTLRDAFDKFKSTSMQVDLESLNRIESIKKNNGLVSISTIDKSPIHMLNFEVNHNSRLKIANSHAETSLLVYSGIKLKRENYWQRLNYLVIDKINGELLIDYDQHYKKKLPTRKIIMD